MRRYTSLTLIGTLAGVLAACGGDSPAAPDVGDENQVPQLAGWVYDLATIDGAVLPFPDGTRAGCTALDGTTYARTEVRIAAMQLAFVDSGLYTLAISTEERCLGDDWTTPTTDWSTRPESRTGTYTSEGSSGTLNLGAAAFPFTFRGDDLTVYFLPSAGYGQPGTADGCRHGDQSACVVSPITGVLGGSGPDSPHVPLVVGSVSPLLMEYGRGDAAALRQGQVRSVEPARPYVLDPDSIDFGETARWAFHVYRWDENLDESLCLVVGVKQEGDGGFRVFVRDYNMRAREDDDPWWQRTAQFADDFIRLVRDCEHALDLDDSVAGGR